MMQDVVRYEGRIAKVRGGAGCGKTEALIQRALYLLARGESPQSIFVEAASPAACNALRRRLIAAADNQLKEAAAAVPVQTALEACVSVLGEPAATAFVGRAPRVLNDAEYKFLLEDLKTLGLPIRRLRRILSRFYERWNHMADESTWLEPGDESQVFELLRSLLTALDAMLAQEVPLFAARYLQSDAGAPSAHCHEYVLCDDFQNLTRAEQSCMCLLAGKQLVVFGNPNEVCIANKEHANPAGFTEFDARRKNVDVFTLDETFVDADISAFADALLDSEGMDASYAATSAGYNGKGVECIKWNTPEEELDGLTKLIRVSMDAKDAPAASDVCIIVPNKRWARSVEKVLKKRGFETSSAGVGYGLPGDPRERWEDSALAVYVRLGLVAHPDDAVLWRCWCGFGNYLTNSDKWMFLLDYAKAEHLGVLAALEKLARAPQGASMPFAGADKLAQRYREGMELVDKNKKRKGFVLLRAVGANNVREFQDAIEKVEGDESAQSLFALFAASTSLGAAFPDNSRVMRIATYENMAGINAETIILFAAIDGFMPARDAFEVVSTDADRAAVMLHDRRLLHSVAAKARSRLVISYFSTADLETAERTKMQVARVYAKGTGRVARVRPSTFLREAGAACPVTNGGQAKLSELGLM